MNCCESHMAMGRVVCPTPRRLGPFHADDRLIMPFRFLRRNDIGVFDAKQGAESMGTIFSKEDHEAEQSSTLASSPPFFFGSPPCRAPNPLVQDSHFGLENSTPKCSSPSNSAVPSSAHTGAEFGTKQETVW
ncbi:uncharacterized protein [Henckelia pumila]|uniref:uncharacterized protein isoform X2 n=1 Tax=Henckelia pumila TaxID=405737 RepID=UPI003C6E3BD7